MSIYKITILMLKCKKIYTKNTKYKLKKLINKLKNLN